MNGVVEWIDLRHPSARWLGSKAWVVPLPLFNILCLSFDHCDSIRCVCAPRDDYSKNDSYQEDLASRPNWGHGLTSKRVNEIEGVVNSFVDET